MNLTARRINMSDFVLLSVMIASFVAANLCVLV